MPMSLLMKATGGMGLALSLPFCGPAGKLQCTRSVGSLHTLRLWRMLPTSLSTVRTNHEYPTPTVSHESSGHNTPPLRIEISLLLHTLAGWWRQRATAAAVRKGTAGAGTKSLQDIAAALEAEDAAAAEAHVLSRAALLVVRGCASIIAECVFAGFGTLLWPGSGTVTLQLLGNVLCYRF